MSTIAIQKEVPLAPYTTFGIGGSAEYFATIPTLEACADAIQFAKANSLGVTVLGGGSNVLISDDGVRGLVIKNEIAGIAYTEEEEYTIVHAGAGVTWDTLVAETVAKGLWGLENLSGIPGTVGGALVQNINAYGVTIEELVVHVSVMHTETGETKIFDTEQCAFAYRNSFFKRDGIGKKYIVTGVTLRLSGSSRVRAAYKSASQSMERYFNEHEITDPAPADVRAAILEIRGRIGMLGGQYKSAGSFFTNVILSKEAFKALEQIVLTKYPENAQHLSPWHWLMPNGNEKVSTAFLMECTEFNKTAFAGKRFNDAVSISPRHTLSLINVNNATAKDVQDFAQRISEKIYKEFNIKLESEVCFL